MFWLFCIIQVTWIYLNISIIVCTQVISVQEFQFSSINWNLFWYIRTFKDESRINDLHWFWTGREAAITVSTVFKGDFGALQCTAILDTSNWNIVPKFYKTEPEGLDLGLVRKFLIFIWFVEKYSSK